MHVDGEFALLAHIARHLTGAGDDAAVITIGDAHVVLATDALVHGRHWRDDLSSLQDVGWKAIAVNVSDLAAMGSVQPRAALVALMLPSSYSTEDVDELYVGMHAACQTYGLELVGGDTTAASELAIAVSIVGHSATAPVWRSGAAASDRLVIVGQLGASAAALAYADAGLEIDAAALAAHRRPKPLLNAGRVLSEFGATAMIDISDGLGQDAAHLAAASGVQITLSWQALPVAASAYDAAAQVGIDPMRLACAGGEDYALLAALPADVAFAAAEAAGAAEGVAAAVVGTCTNAGDARGPVLLQTDDGPEIDISTWGWDHFQQKEDR